MTSPFRPAPDPAKNIENAVLKLMEGRIGRANAISREGLLYEVPMLVDRNEKINDRQIREAIERLRRTPQGATIISDPGWRGYYHASSYEEWWTFLERQRKTALTMLRNWGKQKQAGKQHWSTIRPQMELFNA